jgi:SAM-dependent MidA family methyltransferase
VDFQNSVRRAEADKMRVFEMGPGTGTFALSFLDYLKNYNGDIYKTVEYNLIEISP